MSRLPELNREDMSPDDQAILDRVLATRSGMGGPTGVLMYVPELAGRMASAEDYLRLETDLPGADRELVILATAREVGARYAWARHERRAAQDGTRPEAVEILRARDSLDGLTPRERLLVDVAQTLLRTRALPDELYRRAEAELGRKQLVETVALIGHYNFIGLLLGAFEVPPPPDMPNF
ncbi:MAG TPA: carboxymuconolactone decarboxylase family protein [Chloroflexota bacterium]|jgi:4-carboxymuconolactone decarboxylase|nr:carboxymuconolactone decarboxylase family protein [Chloroflexota bacterium]